MKVGVPTEIKVDEYRVAMTPGGRARARGRWATRFYVQQGAGLGSAISDEAYIKQGAHDPSRRGRPCSPRPSMIVKVKEPQPVEVAMLESRHIAFHLSAPRRRRRAHARARRDRRDLHRL